MKMIALYVFGAVLNLLLAAVGVFASLTFAADIDTAAEVGLMVSIFGLLFLLLSVVLWVWIAACREFLDD